MSEFSPEQYREELRKKLGVKNMPIQPKVEASTYQDTSSKLSTYQSNNTKFGHNGGGESVDPNLLADAPENNDGGEEVNQEQVEPALALLHTLLQSVDEQTQTSNDKETGVMWRSLHNYIWKNRNKIAKKMMDDAQ